MEPVTRSLRWPQALEHRATSAASTFQVACAMSLRRESRLLALEDVVDLLVGSVPPLPFKDNGFDAVVMSFTLELFAMETIPKVLAECRRVLKPDGRLGVVSMATVESGQHESVLERTYVWMHTHFPHIVDCQPIPLEALLENAGFSLCKHERIDLFTMPVAIVVAK